MPGSRRAIPLLQGAGYFLPPSLGLSYIPTKVTVGVCLLPKLVGGITLSLLGGVSRRGCLRVVERNARQSDRMETSVKGDD
jgi:hypothetical protein